MGKKKLSGFIGKGKSLQISLVQQTIEFTLGLTIYEQRKVLTVQMIMKNRSRIQVIGMCFSDRQSKGNHSYSDLSQTSLP